MSIRTRLLLILLGLSVVSAGVVLGSYLATEAENQALRSGEAESYQLLRQVDQVDAAYSDEEVSLRNFLMSGDEPLRTAYILARDLGERATTGLSATARRRPDLAPTINQLLAAGHAWQTTWADRTLQEFEDPNSTFDLVSNEWTQRGSQLLSAVRATLRQLRPLVGAPGPDLQASISQLATVRRAAVLFGLLLVLLTAAFANALLVRWVSRPLGRLVGVARRVESGEDVTFGPEGRRDEIGELGSALERMHGRLIDQQRVASAEADEARVQNRMTEVATYVEDDRRVSEAILQAFREIAEPREGVVHLSNSSSDRAIPEASFGEAAAEPLTLHALSGCPGVRRANVYLTSDLTDALSVRCPAYRADAGTLACVPLVALGNLVGAVHLHWPQANALEPRLVDVLERISERTALSIANRRLVRALEGMATTDARTGLANMRAVDRAIEKELEGLEDDGQASVLMLDLDHFKRLNDRHGHPAGDEALRVFAEILRSCVRQEDLAGRYGGEEFVVILPGLDVEAATEIAERIRRRTESTSLVLGPGVNDRMTVSIGVASAPVNGRSRTELLRASDAALYQAKEAGRNRVVVVGSAEFGTASTQERRAGQGQEELAS